MSAAETLEPLSQGQRFAIGVSALAFVALTAWQVSGRRDDWPLASFEMYSGLQGPVASRSLVKGVSDEGEFELTGGELGPFGAARLRHLNAKLAGSPQRRARFVRAVQANYEAQREARGAPVLQALRSYTETWKIRPGLAGIDRPKRRLNDSTYLPPTSLLARLELERSGNAPPVPGRTPPEGDQVVEILPEQCAGPCAAVEDPNASGGSALEVPASGATLHLPLSLAKGRWTLFLRMKTEVQRGADRIRVALDGKDIAGKKGIGNYRPWLGDGAWVWASAAPGAPPAAVSLEGGAGHTLTLRVKKGPLRLDQLWLSRSRREIPTFNAPAR